MEDRGCGGESSERLMNIMMFLAPILTKFGSERNLIVLAANCSLYRRREFEVEVVYSCYGAGLGWRAICLFHYTSDR